MKNIAVVRRQLFKIYTSAFTLVEILIVLAILITLSAVGWPSLNRWQSGSYLSSSAEQLASTARSASVSAQAGFMNREFGLKLFADHVVVFQGTNYSSRLTSEDRTISLERGVGLAWQLNNSSDEIVFSKNTGLPSTNGLLTLTGSTGTAEVSVNQIGLIDLVIN